MLRDGRNRGHRRASRRVTLLRTTSCSLLITARFTRAAGSFDLNEARRSSRTATITAARSTIRGTARHRRHCRRLRPLSSSAQDLRVHCLVRPMVAQRGQNPRCPRLSPTTRRCCDSRATLPSPCIGTTARSAWETKSPIVFGGARSQSTCWRTVCRSQRRPRETRACSEALSTKDACRPEQM